MALSSSSIRVAVLEENGERVLMEGKFTHKINTESSLWSLEPGKCVLVSVGSDTVRVLISASWGVSSVFSEQLEGHLCGPQLTVTAASTALASRRPTACCFLEVGPVSTTNGGALECSVSHCFLSCPCTDHMQ